MKSLKLIIALILISYSGYFAQSISSGYYVVPSGDMNEDSKSYLENKLKNTLMSAGVTAVEGNFPIVTAIYYHEIETIEIPGARTTYKNIGEVSIFILFENTKQELSSTAIHVEGVGNTKTIAINNCIQNINIPEDQLESLISKAKANYKPALENYSSGKLKDAKSCYSLGNYDSAIDIANDIPMESKCYKEGQKLIQKIHSIRAARIKELQDKLAADKEEKNYQRQQEMKFELEKIRLEQNNIVRQDKVNNRSKVEEGFSKLWNSILGKN
jgi:hypothetical protein